MFVEVQRKPFSYSMHMSRTWKSNCDVKFKLTFLRTSMYYIKISNHMLQCFTLYKVSKSNHFICGAYFSGFILGCFRNEINEGRD